MATVLLCAGAPGKRYSLPNSTIHQHPAGVGGIGGYAPDVEIQARELIRQQSKVRQIMATHTGQTMERISHDFDRDMYMDADQAKDYGIIDEIMPTAGALPGAEKSSADSLIAGGIKL
jgi:ATP-dependent Clp protease protease subunit